MALPTLKELIQKKLNEANGNTRNAQPTNSFGADYKNLLQVRAREGRLPDRTLETPEYQGDTVETPTTTPEIAETPLEPRLTLKERAKALATKLGHYVQPKPDKVRPVDIARETLPAIMETGGAALDFIQRAGLQISSGLGTVAAPSYVSTRKALGDKDLENISYDQIWSDELRKGEQRMLDIGAPLEPLSAKWKGRETEPMNLFMDEVQEAAKKSNKLMEEGDTAGSFKEAAKIGGYGFMRDWANPFFLFNIKGLSSGSFKMTPKEKVLFQMQLNPAKKDFLALGKGAKTKLKGPVIKKAYTIPTESKGTVNISQKGKVTPVKKPDVKIYLEGQKGGPINVKVTNSGGEILNKDLVKTIQENVKKSGGKQTLLGKTGTAPVKPVEPIAKAPITPVEPTITPKVQTDARVEPTLQEKLIKTLQDKQALIDSGRSTPDIQSQVQKLTNIINTLGKGKVVEPTATPVEPVKPVEPLVNVSEIKQASKQLKKEGLDSAHLQNLAANAQETRKPVATPVVKATPKEPEFKAPTELFHGSAGGRVKVDRQGNVNLGTSEKEIARFGEPIKVNTKGLKIQHFKTKEELFNNVANRKQYWKDKGVDVLMADNHAIAITPQTFAKKIGTTSFNRGKQVVGAMVKRYTKSTTPAKPVGKPKSSQTVDQAKALKELGKARKQVKKSTYETIVKKQKAKEPKISDLEKSQKEKELKEIIEKVTDKEKLQKTLDKQGSLNDKLLIARASLNIEQARLKTEIKTNATSIKVAKENVKETLAKKEYDEVFNQKMKGLDEEYNLKESTKNYAKEYAEEAREEMSLDDFKQELELDKLRGKDQDYFRKLYQEKFDKGKDKQASAIFSFIENNYGFIRAQKLIDMALLKPLETAMNRGWTKGLTFAYENLGAKQLMDSIQHTLKKSSIVNLVGKKMLYQYGQPEWYKKLTEMAEREKVTGQMVSEEMMKLLTDGLTDAEKVDLNGAIINHGEHMNPKIADRAKVARAILDDYGDQYWRLGAIDRKTFEANKGEYMLRAYYDKELKKPLTQWARSGGHKASLQQAKKRGITRQVPTEDVEKFTAKGWTDRGQAMYNFGKPKKGMNTIWRDYTVKERKAMGEITNAPGYLVGKGIEKVSSDIAVLRLFDETAKHPEVVSDEAIGDFQQLPKEKGYGKLSGKWVEPYIYEDIKGMVEAKSMANKIGDQMLSEWKKWKVVDNPATHMRNMYFNFMLSDIAGLSPHRVDVYGSALVDVIKRQGDFIEARKLNLFGTSFIGNELGVLLKDADKIKSMTATPNEKGVYDIDWKDQIGDNIFATISKMKGMYDKVQGKLGKLYEGEEEFNKLALYKYAKNELGYTPEDAVTFAKKWGLNYAAVTPFVNQVSKRIWGVPFVRFQLLAAPRLVEGAVTRPFTYLKWITIAVGLEEYARKKLGITKENLGKIKSKLFPEWMQNGLYILAPEKDKYGQYQFLDLSYIVPYVQDVKDPNIGDYLYQNPFFTIPAEIALNKSRFTGEKVYDETKELDPTLATKIKAYAGYTYKQLAPPIAPGGYSFKKVVDAAMKKKDGADRVRSLNSAVVDSMFGIKLRTIDIDKEKEWRLKELETKIGDMDYEIGKMNNGQGKYANWSEEKQKQQMMKAQSNIHEMMEEASGILSIGGDTRFVPLFE